MTKFENDWPNSLKEIYKDDNDIIKKDIVIIAIKNIKNKMKENNKILNVPKEGFSNFNELLSKLNLSDIIKN